MDVSSLSEADARWVDFRMADTQWRSAAATDNSDPTRLDEARDNLEKQIRDLTREEPVSYTHLTDFTAGTLAKVIPSKDAKILIYCNNNFEGSPVAFALKAPSASLNISTYTALRSYGYTNIFELGPLLNVHTTSIPFEGSELK